MNNPPHTDQHLPRAEILKKKNEIQHLFANGRWWNGNRIRIIFLDQQKRQVGFSVPKNLGKAVRRNRIKRLMREAYRLNRKGMRPLSIFMIALSASRQVCFREIETDFKAFLHTVGQ